MKINLPVTKSTVSSAAILALCSALMVLPSRAATDTWTGGTSASWSASGNWSAGVPGSTSSTTNTDTALFNVAAPTAGNGILTPVVVDPNRNVQNLTFDAAAGAYVVGTTGGNALLLTAGGTIQDAATLTSGVTETVNAPLTLEGNYTFANNSTTAASALQIGGAITGAAGTTDVLTLGGVNANLNNIVSGTITAGASGSMSITKTGTGYWDVTGNNSSYAGNTTITSGTLSIGNSNSLGSGQILLNGGTLKADNAVSLSNSIYQQTVGVPLYFGGSGNISTSGNLTFYGTTGSPSDLINNMTGGATFNVTGTTSLNNANQGSTIGYVIIGGAGNTSLGDIYGGTGLNNPNSQLSYFGSGTFTLNGTDYIQAANVQQTLFGGTTILNYGTGTNPGPRLDDSSNGFFFLGSNLVLQGGSGTVETLVGMSPGQASAGSAYYGTVSDAPGTTSTINIGNFYGSDTQIVNFQPGVALSTTAMSGVFANGLGVSGIFGYGTVAGNGVSEGWATDLTTTPGSGAAIVALPQTQYALMASGGSNQVGLLLQDAGGVAFSNIGQGGIQNVKIDANNSYSAGSLGWNRTNTVLHFTTNQTAILFTGGGSYTMSGQSIYSNGAAPSGAIDIYTYGTGTLTINDGLFGYGSVFLTGGTGNIITGFSGGSTLVKSGNGTLVLGAANGYAYNTLVNGGTLSISSDSNIGGIAGLLNVTTSSTSTKTVVVTGTNSVTTANLVGASFMGTTISSVTGTISSGTLTTLTLTLAANANATISTSTPIAYANGTQSLSINGATLLATSTFSLSETSGTITNNRPVLIGANGATFAVTGTNALSIPGTISVAGVTGVLATVPLYKSGTGTLILSGADTTTGGTFVNQGTLELNFANSGTLTTNILANTGAVSLGGSSTLNVNSAATGSDTQTIASLAITGGADTVSMTNNGATSNALTVTAGAYTRTAGSTVDFVAPAGTSITLANNVSNPFLGTSAFFGTGTVTTYAATGATGTLTAATLTGAAGVNALNSATTNYSYTSGGSPDTLTASRTANAVDIGSSVGAQTIDLGAAGANTLTLNGLLNTGGALTIQRSGGTGSVVIGTSNELVLGGVSNINISAPISNAAGALTDSDSATVTLSGANTYTGTTSINAGTLAMTGGSNSGSAFVTTGAGIFTQSGGVISGTSSITQGSTGTSTLAGSNTYSGLTTVSAGELDLANLSGGQSVGGSLTVSGGLAMFLAANQINSGGSISVSSGTLTLNGFNQTVAGVQITGGVLASGTGTLTSTSAFDLEAGQVTANLAGSVGLNKTTIGSAQLTGTNTYTGATSITNGELGVSVITGASSNFGTATSAITLGGSTTSATLAYNGSTATYTRGFTIGAGGAEIDTTVGGQTLTIATGTVDTTSGGNLTVGGYGNTSISSAITGSGGLTFDGLGTVTLSGSNTFTGTVSIVGPVLNVGSISALGTGTSNILFGGASAYSYASLQYSANNSVDYSSRFLSNIAAITIDTNGQVVTYASGIGTGNTGGLFKAGVGKLVLSGSNTYTGTTVIGTGYLTVANAGALGGGGTITFSSSNQPNGAGGVLQYTAANAVDYSSRIKNNGNAIAIDTNGQNVGFASALANTNTAGLLKLGSGTLSLTAANLYTGTTTVAAGTLDLKFNGTSAPTSNILTTAGALVLTGGTLEDDSATSGTNAQTLGLLTVSSGSDSILMVANGATTDTLTFSGAYTRAAGSTIDFVSPTTTTITLSANPSNPFLGTGAFFGTGSSETYAATNASGVVIGATLTGAAGVNTFTSGTVSTVAFNYTSPGATDTLVGNHAANAALFNLSSAQTIDTGTATLTINGILNTGSLVTIQRSSTGSISNGGNELVLGGSGSITISAPIAGAGALTDSDTGTVVLSGTNTYTGVTTINGGTLSASNIVVSANASNLGNATSAIVINDGGILSYTGGTASSTRGYTIGSGGGEIDVTTGGATLGISGGIAETNDGYTTFGGAGNFLTSGVVSGAGGVIKNGAGSLTMSAASTYYGGTTVNGGALIVTNTTGSAIGTGPLSVAGAYTLAGTGTIQGSGFNISGTGTSSATRANVYVGQNATASNVDTNTASKLTLIGTGSVSNISNANLVFNLNAKVAGGLGGTANGGGADGSGVAGSGNALSVGISLISFGTTANSVQLTLNLQNEPTIIAAFTPYVLIAGTGSTSTLTGLSTGQYAGLTLGATSAAPGGGTETLISAFNMPLTFAGTTDAAFYQANSYLVLYQNGGVDDIDVVVVPEPSTWALIASGLAFLVIYQKRRHKSGPFSS